MESGSKALRAPDIVKSIRVIVSPLALQTHKFDPVILHGYIMHQEGVWAATGAEIIEWYRQHAAAD